MWAYAAHRNCKTIGGKLKRRRKLLLSLIAVSILAGLAGFIASCCEDCPTGPNGPVPYKGWLYAVAMNWARMMPDQSMFPRMGVFWPLSIEAPPAMHSHGFMTPKLWKSLPIWMIILYPSSYQARIFFLDLAMV